MGKSIPIRDRSGWLLITCLRFKDSQILLIRLNIVDYRRGFAALYQEVLFLAMSKPKTPKHSRISSPPVNIINLIVLGLLLLILIAVLIPDDLISFTIRILLILLGTFSIAGLVLSSMLNLQRSKNREIEYGIRDTVWKIGSPEEQKSKLTVEVLEIAAILDIPEDQYSDLILAYIVAEDLALRQIQQEAAQPVIRHASIGNTEFDGLLVSGNQINCIEVTFLVAPELSADKIERIRKKILAAKETVSKKFPDSSVKLLLVLVMQLDALGEAKLRSAMTKDKFAAIPVNIDIQLYSFEGLQQIYTTD